MKLPESVKVAGHVYEIRQKDADWRDNGDKHGLCNITDLFICVAMDKRWKETLIHEIFHAIDWEYCLSAAQNEEQRVSLYGVGWFQVLTDCPELKRVL